MAATVKGERWTRWMWLGAGTILLLPLAAMALGGEFRWNGFDFLAAGLLLATACGVIDLAARRSPGRKYSLAAVLAVLAGLGLVWANLAVGVVGSEDDRFNLAFPAIVLAALVASVLVRGRARAMAVILPLAAVALLVAVSFGQASAAAPPSDNPLVEWLAMILVAGLLFVSGALFRASASGEGA